MKKHIVIQWAYYVLLLAVGVDKFIWICHDESNYNMYLDQMFLLAIVLFVYSAFSAFMCQSVAGTPERALQSSWKDVKFYYTLYILF